MVPEIRGGFLIVPRRSYWTIPLVSHVYNHTRASLSQSSMPIYHCSITSLVEGGEGAAGLETVALGEHVEVIGLVGWEAMTGSTELLIGEIMHEFGL